MKKFSLIIFLFSIATTALSQTRPNELALTIAPLKFNKSTDYSMLYRRTLKNNKHLRLNASFFVDTDKEVRTDTVTYHEGTVAYTLGVGLQKDLFIEDLDAVNAYVAIDGYWSSKFSQENGQTYYGYFWDLGARPIVGLSYKPFRNIRISLESQANFNVNLQEYTAPGDFEDKDTRFTFTTLDRMALNIGYLF